MNDQSEPPLEVTAKIVGLPYAPMRQMLLHRVAEFDLTPLEDSEEAIAIETLSGLMRFENVGGGVRVRLYSPTIAKLETLRDGFLFELESAVPELAAAVRWSDQASAGKRPASFRFAEVLSVEKLGRDFVRLRVASASFDDFTDDSIHFRLVLPPVGESNPQWPYLGENGATVWPKGEKALHLPVYTVRRVDHAKSEMEFDVFIHEGGRATEWALAARVGDRVAMMGPNGGGVPKAERVNMFADETGFPAVARIIDALPESAVGAVTLLAENGAECGYPIPDRTGISVRWITRQERGLADLALAAHQNDPEVFLWIASERAEVQKVRSAVKSKFPTGTPGKSYIAAYWTA